MGRVLCFLATSLLVAVAGAAPACQAPKIPNDRLQQAASDIGKASFQSDPATVILRLTFTAPDAAPMVETIFAGGDKRYAAAVIAEAELLRLSCAIASAPVTSLEIRRMSVRYLGPVRYRASEPRLKPELQFVDVVRLVKEIKPQSVRLDTRDMGCPFGLRFSPLRPYLANGVEEVGERNPARAPLLEWLRNATLDLPSDMMATAIGRESTVSVPCVVLDLS